MTVRPAFTLGILGSGQLGRMIAIAAAELGIPSHIYAPDASTSPAGQVAAHVQTAEYQDAEALAEFAAGVEAVVCEFENVPASALAILAELVPVSPGAKALQTAQSRQAEKTLARELGIAVPDFWPVASAAELADALVVLDGPGILKTDRMGYDGKGQIRLDSRAAAGEIWQQMGGVPCVLERLVDFSAEISFLVARDAAGQLSHFPASQNSHQDGILARSVAPADCAETLLAEGRQAVSRLAEALQLVGVLAMESFVTATGQLLFNEIAPRPHNSFHWTIEGCATSQFTQLVRVLAGMGFGATDMDRGWQMVNLLGQDMDQVADHLARPHRRVHLYGKTEARPGRKMGHVSWPI